MLKEEGCEEGGRVPDNISEQDSSSQPSRISRIPLINICRTQRQYLGLTGLESVN